VPTLEKACEDRVNLAAMFRTVSSLSVLGVLRDRFGDALQ
jgi:hypothetical protein